MDTLLIEVDEQTTLEVHMEAPPELIFALEGIQGPPGPVSMPEEGDAVRVVGDVLHVDINRLTLAP